MNITLRPIHPEEKETLRDLWEKYDYDSSEYDRSDVNELGLYGEGTLNWYWTKGSYWAYFIVVDAKLAGFVILTDRPVIEGTQMDSQVGEFFVMRKYRRMGVGRRAFEQAFALHTGRHQIVRHPKNAAAVRFWDTVVNEHTKGQYTLLPSHPGFVYQDGTAGDVFIFEL